MLFYRGSAIAKIIGNNVKGGETEFETIVNMYVYEEMFEGKKLSEIINNEHENKKYLPGIKLPENVVRWFLLSQYIAIYTTYPWLVLAFKHFLQFF